MKLPMKTADDPEHDGGNGTHRVGARHQQPGDRTCDDPNDEWVSKKRSMILLEHVDRHNERLSFVPLRFTLPRGGSSQTTGGASPSVRERPIECRPSVSHPRTG